MKTRPSPSGLPTLEAMAEILDGRVLAYKRNLGVRGFSRRLNEAIRKCRFKGIEVAQAVGISSGYLSDLRRGIKGNPGMELVDKLSNALGVSPAWLLGGGESQLSVPPAKCRFEDQAARLLAIMQSLAEAQGKLLAAIKEIQEAQA